MVSESDFQLFFVRCRTRLVMKKINSKSGFLVALAISAPSIVRADVVIEFSELVTGSMPSGSSWATLDIVDSASNEVTMTLTHNTTSVEPQFISSLWLNLTSIPGDLSADFSSPVINAAWGDDFMTDAGNKWDVWFDLLTAPPEDRLNVGDSVTWTMTGTGLDSLDFWTLSTNQSMNGPYYGMAHIQSIPGGDSGKVAAVPEPASLAALGLGAVALLRRCRKV